MSISPLLMPLRKEGLTPAPCNAKHTFKTESHAMRTLAWIVKQREAGIDLRPEYPIRAYWCTQHNGLHLTKKQARTPEQHRLTLEAQPHWLEQATQKQPSCN